jgi:hypothetical protein
MYIKYLKYAVVDPLVQLGLTPSQLLLANIIVSFSKEDRPLIGGQQTIGKLINVSGKTVQRDVKKLQELKLITVKSGRHTRNANQYMPSKKLTGLYGRNVRINMDRKSTNTPKGYNKEEAFLRKLPLKERQLAEMHIKEYGRSIDEVMKYLTK